MCKVYQPNLHQWGSDESLRPAAERKERVRLEAESNSLLTRAFSTPSAALSELRALKAENYGLKRDKGAAEVREAELRRELLQLGRTVRLLGRDGRTGLWPATFCESRVMHAWGRLAWTIMSSRPQSLCIFRQLQRMVEVLPRLNDWVAHPCLAFLGWWCMSS